MQFTERELTEGVKAAAQAVHRTQKGAGDWESLSPYERYLLLEPVGSSLIPAFAALPEVEVEPGTRPKFTQAQLVEAVSGAGSHEGGWLRRKAALAGQVALLKVALEAMPPREDPDTFVVPDHL